MKKPYNKTFKFNWPRKYYGRLNSKRLLNEFKKECDNWNSLQKHSSFGAIEIMNRLEVIEEILIKRNLRYKW